MNQTTIKHHKHQELYKRVNPRAAQPCCTWTDEQWQPYYSILKKKVPPIKDEKIRRSKLKTLCSEPRASTDPQPIYDGVTLYGRYAGFINDVLLNIRLGAVDYCFYIYQIAELLKREPGLKTRLLNNNSSPYFEVWLD